jgi:lipid II:glycine glycyltransferase (peptidoglycan interpeptide bridge formation enzyme)
MGPVSITDPSEWNGVAARLGEGHLLQSWQWGDVKARFGWRPVRLAWRGDGAEAAAQVLERTVEVPGFGGELAMLYCPKGPCLDWDNTPLRSQVLGDLHEFAVRRKAVFLRIDPDVPQAYGLPGEPTATSVTLGREVGHELRRAGWRPTQAVQFRNTMVLDLRPSEAELLEAMHPKTRYNIRLAARHGVQVRRAGEADLHVLYRMYAETSARDRFVIRPQAYYREVWTEFLAAGMAQPLVAEVHGEAVGGLIVFQFGRVAYYLYGMSRAAHREKMPNHLLQWEAIRWARSRGCLRYDLWGAPDRADPSDPLWGVYRFKAGRGGRVVQTIGAWDLPIRRAPYWLSTVLLPQVMRLLRSRQMERTRTLVELG